MLPKAQEVVPWEAPSLNFQQVLNTSFKNQAQLKILQLTNNLKQSITVHYFISNMVISLFLLHQRFINKKGKGWPPIFFQ